MVLNLLSHGFQGGAAVARRLRHFRFQAGFRLERLRRRCDLALRAWGARGLVREMQAWPDERLKDIGLSRADIAGAIEGVRRPFHWQPESEGARLDPSRFGH